MIPISRSIDVTSAAGVASAENVAAISTATRQPFRMARPLMMPARFSATRNTGSTKATPITIRNLNTKS